MSSLLLYYSSISYHNIPSSNTRRLAPQFAERPLKKYKAMHMKISAYRYHTQKCIRKRAGKIALFNYQESLQFYLEGQDFNHLICFSICFNKLFQLLQ